MPQHNETERQLLALLKQEQDRNSSTVSPVQAAALPDIDPLMFLSPSAQRECEAAQTFRPLTVAVPQVAAPEIAVAQVPEGVSLTADDFTFTDPGWDIEAEMTASPSQGAEATPDLDSIFMGRALREIGDTPAARLRAERLGTDIEFSQPDFTIDSSGNLPMYTAPRRSGGQVVSQRGPNGFVPVPRQVPAVVRQAQIQAAKPSAPQAPAKSRYERLLGKSIID